MKKIIFLLLCTACLISLSSCTKSSSVKSIIANQKYFAFKESKDDRWGIISADGKIIIENEFVQKPFYVYNDRFFVRNDDGLIEMYSINKKPKSYGIFSQVLPFIEDVTAVVRPDQPIELINKDGEVISTLSNYKGQEIVKIQSFSNGLAAFCNAEGLWGYINTKGKVVIDPIYNTAYMFYENKAIVHDEDYSDIVIDTSGKVLFKVKDNVSIPNCHFTNGYLICHSKEDSQIICYNEEGEKCVKKLSKYYNCANVFSDKYFIVYSSGKAGVVDNEGETVIRTKYDEVEYYDNDFLVVKDNGKCGIIDYDDNVICDFDYKDIGYFVDGKAYARLHDEYVLIDKKGNEVDRKKSYSDIEWEFLCREKEIESEYLDYHSAIQSLISINKNGINGILLDETAETIAKHSEKSNPKDYIYSSTIKTKDQKNKYLRIMPEVSFDNSITEPIIERQQWGWSTYDQVVGYKFNDKAKACQISASIYSESHKVKLEYVLKELCSYVTSLGIELRQDNTDGSYEMYYQNDFCGSISETGYSIYISITKH